MRGINFSKLDMMKRIIIEFRYDYMYSKMQVEIIHQ